MVAGWVEASLGDEADLLTGFPFPSRSYSVSPNDIPLLRGDNISQGRLRWEGVKYWPRSEAPPFRIYELRRGDVVLAMDRPWIDAGLKYAAIGEEDEACLLVQRVARIRAGEDLDANFLRYLLGSPKFTDYVLAVQTGTTVPHLSAGQIKSFRFFKPPLEEQVAVGGLLQVLDEKIDLNSRMAKTLEAMVRALFKSWFVDFEPVGSMPLGWEFRKLREVVSINLSRYPMRAKID